MGRARQLPHPEACPLPELELAMDCGPDGKAFRRMNAMHLLLLGADFELVRRNSRVSERILRLWIARFNDGGIDGLAYRPYLGRPRNIAPETVASEILPVIEEPALAGQTHWTITKLHGWLRQPAKMWGRCIVGFRSFRYTCESGRSGGLLWRASPSGAGNWWSTRIAKAPPSSPCCPSWASTQWSSCASALSNWPISTVRCSSSLSSAQSQRWGSAMA